MSATLEASPAFPPAAWLFQDHSFASITGTTIGTAITDLTQYMDPAAVNRATQLAESFSDAIRPDEKVSDVALAALIFARRTMVDLSDAVAEIDED